MDLIPELELFTIGNPNKYFNNTGRLGFLRLITFWRWDSAQYREAWGQTCSSFMFSISKFLLLIRQRGCCVWRNQTRRVCDWFGMRRPCSDRPHPRFMYIHVSSLLRELRALTMTSCYIYIIQMIERRKQKHREHKCARTWRPVRTKDCRPPVNFIKITNPRCAAEVTRFPNQEVLSGSGTPGASALEPRC